MCRELGSFGRLEEYFVQEMPRTYAVQNSTTHLILTKYGVVFPKRMSRLPRVSFENRIRIFHYSGDHGINHAFLSNAKHC